MKALLFSLTAVLLMSLTSRADEPAVGHMVFFELKEKTPEAKKKLVDSCYKYLKDLDGVIYFSAGGRAEDVKEGVSATDWDVALHVVFKDKKSHDSYLKHEQHTAFVKENKDSWKGVKVYDSYLDASRK